MHIPVKFANSNHFTATPLMVLAGDIGATKINLGLFQFTGESFSIVREKRFLTKDFSEAGEMIRAFLPDEKADIISLGVAGPVQDEKVSITNMPWKIDARVLSTRFKDSPVHLINDLEATAFGLSALKPDDIHTIYEGKNTGKGNIGLIAPGTGLGEAGLYWDGTHYHPFATEGGHTDFAARTELDMELYTYLHRKFGHISWERLISGPGITSIFDFLRNKKDREVPAWLEEKLLAHDPAAIISENAEEAAICGETMNLFITYLATESANLALKLKAMGGIFIGGGILPKILRLVHADHFLKSFRDFGRLKPLLQDVPVKIILNEKAALLGAACYGAFSLKKV